MSYSAALTDGFLPGARSSEPTNTIAQFQVVCLDTTTAGGVVRPDSANAGKVAGINVSTGKQSDGTSGVGIPVQPGNTCRVACDRVEKAQVKSGVTVAIGDSIYAAAADAGVVTNVATSNKFVGVALEASTGGTADIIAVRVHALAGV